MRDLVIFLFIISSFSACKVNYSFTGADIPANAKTFSVKYFSVNAPLADPTYGQRLTESLKELLLSQTPMDLTNDAGDIRYEGYIRSFDIAPVAAVSNETASLNRLTVSVQVKYENTLDQTKNFESAFTRFADFDANSNFDDLEDALLEEINEQIIQDIFDRSLGNW